MRKTSLKRKLNGAEKSEKNAAEVDSNGSLISDDMSDHENESPSEKKDDAPPSDDGAESDVSSDDEKLGKKVTKKLKKKDNVKDKKSVAKDKKTKPKPQSETEFEVDEVVGMKKNKGKKLFLIRWKGYDASSDTWEPESDLNCPAKIAAYLASADDVKKEEDKKSKRKSDNAKEKKTTKRAKEETSESEEDLNEEDEREEKRKKSLDKTKKRKSDVKEKKTPKRAKEESSDSEEETKEYEVEKIIEVHHKKNGKKEYLVRWKGYSTKEDTWEPEAHLQCPELISKFNEKVEKGKSVGSRELRVNPTHTEPYTLTMKSSGRRVSRRGDGKQRARYYEAE